VHQIDDNFIGDTNDRIFRDLVGLDLPHRLIRKIEQRLFDASDIFRRAINQQIDITGGADKTIEDDRESADDNIFDASFI
jgi:hypothetical protein